MIERSGFAAPAQRSWVRVHLWEHLLVMMVVVAGLLYALPSVFPSQPSLQISANTSKAEVNAALVRRAERLLDAQNIAHQGGELISAAGGRSRVELSFADAANQLRARSVITAALGHQYVTALNTSLTLPTWLEALGGRSIKLGLDLQGGVHFLLQVDTQEALNQRLEALQSEVRDLLQKERVQFISMGTHSTLPDAELVNSLQISFATDAARDRASDRIEQQLGNLYQINSSSDAQAQLDIALSSSSIRDIESAAVEQNLISLRNRVNELGVAEPLIQRQGRNRIVVELPGVQDTTQAKRVIGATANLEFRLEAEEKTPQVNSVSFAFRDQPGQRARLERDIIVTGANVIDAKAGFDENGGSQVNIELDGPGGSHMGEVTRGAIGRRMGAVFIEYKTRQETDAAGNIIGSSRFIEKSLISLATIQGAFANRFRITGLRDQFESAELALLLRAGSLAAPVYFVEERTIGASLGEENIRLGSISMLVGLAMVALFMLVFYRGCGALTITALLINTCLIIAALALLSATLTLPGIAGLVLTLGMVVDANILIFARIRSELKQGASPPIALENGFSRAFVTILDANITTLLVAIILFAIGTGPVRGFAITLSFGIVGSLLTCTFMVRYVLKLTLGKSGRLSPLMLTV